MKKKLVLSVLILLVFCGICFTAWNSRVASTITLDINPSIEIKLDRHDKIKGITPLNDDAKDIIGNDYSGKTLDESIRVITKKIIEKDYIEDGRVVILLHSDGKLNIKTIESKIKDSFDKEHVSTEIIIVDNITKEDKKIAQKYNISPAKAAYINSIKKENEKLDKEDLMNRSINELQNTKESGRYCDSGYTLEGDFCLKEISRSSASTGDICPQGYSEYNGKCYSDTGILESDKLVCNDGFELDGTNCTRSIVEDGIGEDYYCSKGQLKKLSELGLTDVNSGNNEYVCADLSNAVKPTLRCLNNKGHIMVNGKCYNGPAPTIGGGCPNGDLLRNGGCYSPDTYDQYECPDGRIYEKSKGLYPEYCPETVKTTRAEPKTYRCPDGYSLEGTKCIKKEIEPARHERYCPTGYTIINDARCIDLNKTKAKEKGLVCTGENVRLIGNVCITYEIIDAKS